MKPRNFHAKELRTPKFRMRVVKDKTKYTRKIKHKGEENGKDPHNALRT